MLAYLMMGLHTALPVMIGTVMIVATLDFHLGRKQAVLRVIANFAGGVSSVIVLVLLAIHPSLATFTLCVLASALLFGLRISHGDPMAQLLTGGLQRLPDRVRHRPAFGYGNVRRVADARRLFLPRRPLHDRNDGADLAASTPANLETANERRETRQTRRGCRAADGPPLGRRRASSLSAGYLRLTLVPFVTNSDFPTSVKATLTTLLVVVCPRYS